MIIEQIISPNEAKSYIIEKEIPFIKRMRARKIITDWGIIPNKPNSQKNMAAKMSIVPRIFTITIFKLR
jgi:hypothetical protein